MKKLKLAIIGQGRSGANIHGTFYNLKENEYFEVVAVVELIKQRRIWAKEKYPDADIYSDYTELFKRKDIDVVVNATFSYEHYSITKDLLLHGFNVLVEKPMSISYNQARELIAIAKKKKKMVTVFQQNILGTMFGKFKELMNSGIIGDITQINIKYNGFSRRYDWQTLQCWGGGSIYNTGPHPIGQALDLLNWDKNVKVEYSFLKNTHSAGDGDDYAKVILTAPNKPLIDLEVSCDDAYPTDMFMAKGSLGSIVVSGLKWKVKYIKKEELGKLKVVEDVLTKDGGKPAYCSEKLNWYEDSGDCDGKDWEEVLTRYYKQLYEHLKNGKPLQVTPEMGAETVRIIEQITLNNPLPVKYSVKAPQKN